MDENRSICKLCQQPIAVKGGNTSNLFSHLKTHHPKKYSDLKAGSAVTEASTLEQSDQPTILDALSSVQKYTRGSKRWKQLTEAVYERNS